MLKNKLRNRGKYEARVKSKIYKTFIVKFVILPCDDVWSWIIQPELEKTRRIKLN